MDSRHETPRCWTTRRRGRGVVSPRGDVDCGGVCATNGDVVVALLLPPRSVPALVVSCARSVGVWAAGALRDYTLSLKAVSSATPSRRARCRPPPRLRRTAALPTASSCLPSQRSRSPGCRRSSGAIARIRRQTRWWCASACCSGTRRSLSRLQQSPWLSCGEKWSAIASCEVAANEGPR